MHDKRPKPRVATESKNGVIYYRVPVGWDQKGNQIYKPFQRDKEAAEKFVETLKAREEPKRRAVIENLTPQEQADVDWSLAAAPGLQAVRRLTGGTPQVKVRHGRHLTQRQRSGAAPDGNRVTELSAHALLHLAAQLRAQRHRRPAGAGLQRDSTTVYPGGEANRGQ